MQEGFFDKLRPSAPADGLSLSFRGKGGRGLSSVTAPLPPAHPGQRGPRYRPPSPRRPSILSGTPIAREIPSDKQPQRLHNQLLLRLPLLREDTADPQRLPLSFHGRSLLSAPGNLMRERPRTCHLPAQKTAPGYRRGPWVV